jgi:hypothetical protein
MQVNWNAHRFSGGALALDMANTVVLRGDAGRTFDRFERWEEIGRFAEAASRFRADELGGRRVVADAAQEKHPAIVSLREAVDRCFREAVFSGSRCGRDRPGRAVRRSGDADPARHGGGDLGAFAGRAGGPGQDPHLQELPLAVRRPQPQFQPAVVRHDRLRQPQQGKAAL